MRGSVVGSSQARALTSAELDVKHGFTSCADFALAVSVLTLRNLTFLNARVRVMTKDSGEAAA